MPKWLKIQLKKPNYDERLFFLWPVYGEICPLNMHLFWSRIFVVRRRQKAIKVFKAKNPAQEEIELPVKGEKQMSDGLFRSQPSLCLSAFKGKRYKDARDVADDRQRNLGRTK